MRPAQYWRPNNCYQRFELSWLTIVHVSELYTEYKTTNCCQIYSCALPARGRSQNQTAKYKISTRIQCTKWCGKYWQECQIGLFADANFNSTYVYHIIRQICSLLRGGIAERGGVRVGHRIIEINNQSVVAVPHEKIVNLLATSVGEVCEHNICPIQAKINII